MGVRDFLDHGDWTALGRPLEPPGRRRRTIPFVTTAWIGWLSALGALGERTGTVLAAGAAMVAIGLAWGLVPWARLPPVAQAVPPLAYLVPLGLTRDAAGGAPSGMSVLVVLPVLWFALYGTARQVIVAVGAGAFTLSVPVVAVGGPRYPTEEWRRIVLSVLVLVLVGMAVHLLVLATVRLAEERRLSEERFRRAFDGGPVAMAVLGTDERYERVNDAMCVLTGRSRDDLIGRTPGELTHPDDVERERVAMVPLVHGTTSDYTFEKRILHADGSTRWVVVHAVPIKDGQGRIEHFVGHLLDVTERHDLEDRLRYLAEHDHLTGAWNRRALDDRLRRHLAHGARYGASGALLLVDVDHFKRVNDTHGHPTGDDVVVRVADLFRDRLRSTDTIARLGGDEFAILLPKADVEATRHVAAELVRAVSEEICITVASSERPLRVTISLGATVLDRPGLTAEQAMIAADVALYESKSKGRNRFTISTHGGNTPETGH